MPGTSYVIRHANAADAPALARCRTKLFLEIDNLPDAVARTAFEAACEEILRRFEAKGLATAWLAESTSDRAVVGSIILLTYPRLPAPRHVATTEGYILSVYVAPSVRRQGVARALLHSTIAHARTSGMCRLRLHATSVGRAVYEGAGFVPRDDAMELDLPIFAGA